jgi:hypothetical protein
MTKRYGRARLITPDDPGYQAYLEPFRIARSYQRAMRPPSSRQVFGEQVEELLRNWLGQSRPLSDRRYLEYEERRGEHWVLKYRELDALEIVSRDTIHVFEIKTSSSARSLRRGVLQLKEDREILSLLFPHVCATLLFVDTGMVPAERGAALARMEMTVQLEELPKRAGLETEIGLLWIELPWVVELAGGGHNLSLEWMSEDEGRAGDALPGTEEPLVWTSGEDDELGALGQALREALRREGGSSQGNP